MGRRLFLITGREVFGINTFFLSFSLIVSIFMISSSLMYDALGFSCFGLFFNIHFSFGFSDVLWQPLCILTILASGHAIIYCRKIDMKTRIKNKYIDLSLWYIISRSKWVSYQHLEIA